MTQKAATYFTSSNYIVLCVAAFLFFSSAEAETISNTSFPSKTAYFGVNMGGGSTEWKYLVDTTDLGGSPSTPTAVSEGGPSWGVVIGYDVNKNFAIELQYMRFADAHITLPTADAGSPYVDRNGNAILGIVSKTDAYSLSGKFFLQLGHTRLRAFSAIGIGLVQREDPLVNYSNAYPNPPPYSNYTGRSNHTFCVTPYLSAGLNYSFSRHWIVESGFQYYTGFGKSQVTPISSFIPFAWDAYARLAYQL